MRIVSLLSTAFGVFAMVSPQETAKFAELAIGSGSGWSEIGALYGGASIAVGLIGFNAVRSKFHEGPVVLLNLSVFWFCLALGRIVVAFTAPLGPGANAMVFGVVELLLGGVTFWAGWRLGYDR